MGEVNSSVNIMLSGNPHKSLIGALEAGSIGAPFPTYKLVMKVWRLVKIEMGYRGVTEFSPIWQNGQLQELKAIEINKIWERLGIKRLVQIFDGNILKSFSDLRAEFGIPKETFYFYLQIRHALDKQLKTKALEWSSAPLLSKVVRAPSLKGLISGIYDQLMARATSLAPLSRAREGWETDVGELSDDQ